jgi:hypothetical protein
MNFDLNDLNPAIWFFFDEEDESKGGVCVRSLNPEKLKEMDEKTVKRSFKYDRGRRYEDVKTDIKKRELMQWDYCLADWAGVNNKDGEPILCTPENKVKLMCGSPAFSSFVADSLVAFNAMTAEEKEDAIKN